MYDFFSPLLSPPPLRFFLCIYGPTRESSESLFIGDDEVHDNKLTDMTSHSSVSLSPRGASQTSRLSVCLRRVLCIYRNIYILREIKQRRRVSATSVRELFVIFIPSLSFSPSLSLVYTFAYTHTHTRTRSVESFVADKPGTEGKGLHY